MSILDYRTWKDLEQVYSEVEWLWPKWLPKGYVTLLAADPGVGKSLLALSVAHTALEGGKWYDGMPFEIKSPQRRILWVECEAGEAFHIQRAKRMGIDPMLFIEPRTVSEEIRTPTLTDPNDKARIAELMRSDDIPLVVVDSLSGATGGIDENSSAAGATVQWLAEQARNTNKPVLLIHHMNKTAMRVRGSSPPTIADIRGSTAITQHARMVWTLDRPNEQDEQLIRLACAKSNLDLRPKPIHLLIEPTGKIIPRGNEAAQTWWS